jgi:hypothetical protein
MNITNTNPNPFLVPTAAPTEDSAVKRVSALLTTQPGREWRMTDLEAALPDLGHRRIHAALMGIGRSAKTYPHIHRIARGVYVYDTNRKKRVWVGVQKSNAAAKAKPTSKVEPVKDVKKPVGSPVALRPSSALLMEDGAGNFYVVTPIERKRA